jgi:hypothetical protein
VSYDTVLQLLTAAESKAYQSLQRQHQADVAEKEKSWRVTFKTDSYSPLPYDWQVRLIT